MQARDFEIYLIKTMSTEQALIDRALKTLQVSASDAERIRQEVQDATQLAPGQIQSLIEILGEDASVQEREGQDAIVVRCDFDTWPGLTFQVDANNLGLWTEARFLRSSEIAPPRPGDPVELKPWMFTKDEIATWFGPLEEGEVWLPYEEYGLRGGLASKESAYDVVFSWGLLQRVVHR
ncbi:hypothetical protein [Spirillospora albida]|uniref:hypothetical protein n=1 Tax=Spirillospora albida TaxID=58123 RepID=UPI0012FB2D1B|nr:hypothetical protein [Spirillospora albida]